jgi:hypothetical protein
VRHVPTLALLFTASPALAVEVAVLAATQPGEAPLGEHLNDVYASDPTLSFTHLEVGPTWNPTELATLDAYDVVLVSATHAEMADPDTVEAVIEAYWYFFGPLVSSAGLPNDRTFLLDDAFPLASPDGAPGLGFAGAAPSSFDALRPGHPMLAGVTDFLPPDFLRAEPVANAMVLATFDGTDVPAVSLSASLYSVLSGYSATINAPGLYGDDYRPDGWPAAGDGYTLLANTLRHVAQTPAPHVIVDGLCPGPMEIIGLGLTPGAPTALLTGDIFFGLHSPVPPRATIPGGRCAGQGLPFSPGTVQLRRMQSVGAEGTFTVVLPVSNPALCEVQMALVDLTTCAVSNAFSYDSGN